MTDSAGESDLQESRVYLRPPSMADREEYQELLRASAEFHKPWSPSTPRGYDPFTDEAFSRYLGSMGPAARRERRFICRKADRRILGAVHISEIVRGCFQSAYLGYWIGEPYANQGYMTEGLKQAIELCFGELGLHRLEANIRPENEPSLRLVRACGFEREGFSPRYLMIDGAWRDHERWTILADR
jgi:[ribosomal protein S5]-alanine N-acetyltransferase